MAGWVVSPLADLCCFAGPLVLACGIAWLTANSVGEDEVPLHWWIPLGTCVDVAHVYGTLYRTVFDSEATSRNWYLYLMAGPGLFCITLCINLFLGMKWGWTLLAYFAMYHFAKQPFGILCLYKARFGERGARNHQWDYYTCMLGAAIPMLLIHVWDPDPEARNVLRWFYSGEQFLFRLPEFTRMPLQILYVLVPTAWFLRLLYQRLREGVPINFGKIFIMGAQYLTWYMGTSDHHLTSLAFHNLFHGMSSMLLVYVAVNRRMETWRRERPSTMCWTDKLNEALVSSPWLYVGFAVVLAAIEEVLWDLLVEQEKMPQDTYRRLPKFSPTQQAVFTSFLMMPQLSHYFLDGFIWKMTVQNPGLKDALMQAPAQKKLE